MARRIEILSRRRGAPHAQTLLPSRALAEDIRLSMVKVNSARKQEMLTGKSGENADHGPSARSLPKWRRAYPRPGEGRGGHSSLGRALAQQEPGATGENTPDSLDLPLPPLTVQDLRACLAQPAGEGKGVDRWTSAELKFML